AGRVWPESETAGGTSVSPWRWERLLGDRVHENGSVIWNEDVLADPGVAAGAAHTRCPPSVFQPQVGRRYQAQVCVAGLIGLIREHGDDTSPRGVRRSR